MRLERKMTTLKDRLAAVLLSTVFKEAESNPGMEVGEVLDALEMVSDSVRDRAKKYGAILGKDMTDETTEESREKPVLKLVE